MMTCNNPAPQMAYPVPNDWHDQYGTLILSDRINSHIRMWRNQHRDNLRYLFSCPAKHCKLNDMTDTTRPVEFIHCVQLCSKASFLYLPRKGTALAHYHGIDILYEKWASSSTGEAVWEDRFIATPISAQRDLSIEQIVQGHLTLYTRVSEKLDRVSKEDLNSMLYGFELRPWHQYSMLCPLSKAVLLISDGTVGCLGVLVVLTGGNDELHMAPENLTFNGWEDRILEYVQPNAVRMVIDDACDFVRHLETQEEAVNSEWRRVNQRRREAHWQSILDSAGINLADAFDEYTQKGNRFSVHGSVGSILQRIIAAERGDLDPDVVRALHSEANLPPSIKEYRRSLARKQTASEYLTACKSAVLSMHG